MPVFSRLLGASSPPWRGALLAALAAFLLYIPSLGGGLIYDSVLQVGIDNYIHTPANFADIVTLRVITLDEIDRNRPVQLASLMLDASVWGKNPFGFRLTSALLHAGVCALIFLAALRIMGARAWSGNLAALFGALFFAWHPLGVETVCEPSNREDVLAGFFLLMALVLFLGPPVLSRPRAILRAAAVVFCCFLSAGSKEVGWIAPAVLAVARWSVVLPRDGFQRRDLFVLAASALVVAALAAAILGLKPSKTDIFLFTPEPWSWAQWSDLQPEIFAGQIERLVFPLRLCADYYRDNLAPWTHGWLWLLPAVLAVAAAMIAWRRRAARIGVALFFLALLPSANLLGQFNPLADRFLYLPLAGFVLAFVPWLAAGLARISRPQTLMIAGVAGVVILALFAARSLAYQRVWDNERALWDATLARNPRSWNALLGAGVSRFEAGEFSEAGPYWSQMLSREPESGIALCLIALLEEGHGRTNEADRLFARAIVLEPGLVEPDLYVRYYGWRPRMRAALDSLLARVEGL
jgi:tetratricopeptide (TPR) repeat protein